MSCLRGAQLQAQNIKEISIMVALRIHATADDILKRLSFLTLASCVTDAQNNKGGLFFFLDGPSRWWHVTNGPKLEYIFLSGP